MEDVNHRETYNPDEVDTVHFLTTYNEPTDPDWNRDVELEAADFFQNELQGLPSPELIPYPAIRQFASSQVKHDTRNEFGTDPEQATYYTPTNPSVQNIAETHLMLRDLSNVCEPSSIIPSDKTINMYNSTAVIQDTFPDNPTQHRTMSPFMSPIIHVPSPKNATGNTRVEEAENTELQNKMSGVKAQQSYGDFGEEEGLVDASVVAFQPIESATQNEKGEECPVPESQGGLQMNRTVMAGRVQLQGLNKEHCANQDDELYQSSQASLSQSLCSEDERWLDDADQMLQAQLFPNEPENQSVSIEPESTAQRQNTDDDQNSEHLDMPDIEQSFWTEAEGNEHQDSEEIGSGDKSVVGSEITASQEELSRAIDSILDDPGSQRSTQSSTGPMSPDDESSQAEETGSEMGQYSLGEKRGHNIQSVDDDYPTDDHAAIPSASGGTVTRSRVKTLRLFGEDDIMNIEDNQPTEDADDQLASGTNAVSDAVLTDISATDAEQNIEVVTLSADVENLTMDDLSHYMTETMANITQVDKILHDLTSNEYSLSDEEIKEKLANIQRVVNYRQLVCTEKLAQLDAADVLGQDEESDEMITMLHEVMDAQAVIKKTSYNISQFLGKRNREMATAHFNELERCFKIQTSHIERYKREAELIRNAHPRLLEIFQHNMNPSDANVEHLAQETGVENRLIKKWFAMQRCRVRKLQFNATYPK